MNKKNNGPGPSPSPEPVGASVNGVWFEQREVRLIRNCQVYAASDPAGLPGHNLMLIVDKLARAADLFQREEEEEGVIGVG